uniref:PCI domain-containing protein n=1 Tax=Heterorhabditis bacteriophora TaxID=37862 RepID=A0A1I7WS07_HETBA
MKRCLDKAKQAKKLIKNRPDMPVEDIVSLHMCFIVLNVSTFRIEAFGTVGRELTKLLRIPIDEYNNALRVAELTEFIPVMECFDYRGRCYTASYIIQNMLEHETWMLTEQNVAVICALLDSLLVDQQDQPKNAHLLNNLFVARFFNPLQYIYINIYIYELLFCVHERHDKAVDIVKQLMDEYPAVEARIFYGIR